MGSVKHGFGNVISSLHFHDSYGSLTNVLLICSLTFWWMALLLASDSQSGVYEAQQYHVRHFYGSIGSLTNVQISQSLTFSRQIPLASRVCW